MLDQDADHPCDPTHSIHCCHLIVTDITPGPRGFLLYGFRCLDCTKVSRSQVMVRIPPRPQIHKKVLFTRP